MKKRRSPGQVLGRVGLVLLAVPALAATFAASFGFMLPVSTPQNAIAYGSGVVPITKMIRSGASFDVLGALLIVLLLPVMVELVLGSVGG